MKRCEARGALGREIEAARAASQRIALVPTMGYLHEGHLSLIDRARECADRTVVSIFVNPLQFGPDEDFERYPRDVERDAALAKARGADILFVPPTEELYPRGEPAVQVVAPGLSDRLCGAFRAGHFRGVLTVVAKLFNIARPDVAVFGRKDFQQLVLIRRMAADLDFAVDIVDAPIVREADGLALSSRNVYLSPEERLDATLLHRALEEAQAAFSAGETDPDRLIAVAARRLEVGRHVRPQYIELVDAITLDRARPAYAGAVMALAAHVGRTRLIDNHTLA
ncbi:MAG: pantoate--beta-alanine ligase [Longimicrobiales bacterium]